MSQTGSGPFHFAKFRRLADSQKISLVTWLLPLADV
jgi:hypothetical protein